MTNSKETIERFEINRDGITIVTNRQVIDLSIDSSGYNLITTIDNLMLFCDMILLGARVKYKSDGSVEKLHLTPEWQSLYIMQLYLDTNVGTLTFTFEDKVTGFIGDTVTINIRDV